MPAYNVQEQSASMEIHVNPLVNWVWIGFGVLAIGTGIALLPEAAYSFAMAKVPANAVTTSLVLLALVLLPSISLAQNGMVAPKNRSALERRLEGEIMCTCGCKSPMGSCQMRPNCGHYDTQSVKLTAYLAEGKDYDAVRAAFVEEFGSQAVLAEPLDTGFNRLAWLFPYIAAVVALAGVFFTARRWSRPAAQAATPASGVDPVIDARLDDELRNLD
jgi:cytochrome c-type biogenesis protein CcmF